MPTKRLSLALILTISMLALLPASGAVAAPAVTNANDSGPGSLRASIEGAAPGETVSVPPGTYTLTSEPLLVMKSLTIAGNSAGDTIIRSGGSTRVFEIVGAGPVLDVTISDVTIRDGLVTASPQVGAGVLNVQANLTLRDAIVTNNRVVADGAPGAPGGSAQGGGIVSVGEGRLTILDSVVSANAASAIGGSGKTGGTATGGGLLIVSPFTLERSTVSDNLADARGGQGPPNAEQNGGSAVGGGILAVAGSGGSSVTASTISGNLADASAGAGGEGGTVNGGGIYVTNSEVTMALSRMTVTGNTARSSAGPGSSVGAGALLLSGEGALTLTASTIANNTLDALGQGGNLLATPNVGISNTIVAGGNGPAGSENCGVLHGQSLGFNLDSTDQCGFKSAGDLVNTNPLLGPLQNNGGLTETMALPAESPAVDKGSAFGLVADQRGVPRPIDFPAIPNSGAPGADGADIGAFELQPQSSVRLGKLKRNKKKGTAVLTVTVPLPHAGMLTLSGKGLKTQTKAIDGSTGTFKFKVVPKGKVKKALRKRGKRKVGIKVTYSPTGNSAATAKRKAKLVKKKSKKRRGGKGAGGKGKQG